MKPPPKRRNPLQKPLVTAKTATLREFDASYQMDLVRLLFKHNKFCDDMSAYLREDHLDLPVARWLTRTILDYVKAYKVQPTRRALKAILAAAVEAGELESSVGVAVSSFIKIELAKAIPDELHVMDLARNFVIAQKQTELTERLLASIERGDTKAAQAIFAEGSVVSAHFGLTSVDYIEDTERAIQERMNADRSVVPTGIGVLDQHFQHGGPERKCCCLVMAATGVGKSAFTVVLATNAVVAGYKVAVIVLESTKADLRLRLDVAFSGKTSAEIETKPDIVRDVAKRLAQKYRNPLQYERFQPGALTPSKIRAWLQHLSATKNFVPDLLIVDSVDDVSPEENSGVGSLYLDQGNVITDMCNLAEDHNLVLWCTVQGNRETLEAENLKLSMIGDSIKKVQRVRGVVAMCQTFQESLQDPPAGRLVILKNSWGRKNISEPVQFDWARQRILY